VWFLFFTLAREFCSVDPFKNKSKYEVRAPSYFANRNAGMTFCTKTTGNRKLTFGRDHSTLAHLTHWFWGFCFVFVFLNNGRYRC
jgi:ribosomal protein S3AE